MKIIRLFLVLPVFVLVISACGTAQAEIDSAAAPTPTYSFDADWLNMSLTDVQTGKTFTIHDYAGKVVLVETMAVWCPNCIIQNGAVQKLHTALGHPDDLISISLDVDLNEDIAMLKEYAQDYGFDWHFAVAPLPVARALGNLYSAQYLNPPLAPMLLIDRNGDVHQLAYGIKNVEALLKVVEPYLAK